MTARDAKIRKLSHTYSMRDFTQTDVTKRHASRPRESGRAFLKNTRRPDSSVPWGAKPRLSRGSSSVPGNPRGVRVLERTTLPAEQEREHHDQEGAAIQDCLRQVETARVVGGEVAVEGAAQKDGEKQRRHERHQDASDTKCAWIRRAGNEHERNLSLAAGGRASGKPA